MSADEELAAAEDVHGGDTCEEVERQLDDAHGELNHISYWLSRRGYPIDCREKSVADWVLELLPGPTRRRKGRWFR